MEKRLDEGRDAPSHALPSVAPSGPEGRPPQLQQPVQSLQSTPCHAAKVPPCRCYSKVRVYRTTLAPSDRWLARDAAAVLRADRGAKYCNFSAAPNTLQVSAYGADLCGAPLSAASILRVLQDQTTWKRWCKAGNMRSQHDACSHKCPRNQDAVGSADTLLDSSVTSEGERAE